MKLKLLILLFIGLWIFAGTQLSVKESPTFDEPVHIKAGRLYNQGIYDFDPIEPPLIRQIVVTIGDHLNLPYRYIVVTLNGLLLALLISWLGRESFRTAVLAAVFLLLEPNILAYGHYFTTDFISSLLLVLGAYLLLKDKWKHPRFLGLMILLLGLAAAAKVATLSLLLPLLLIKVKDLKAKRMILVVLGIVFLVWLTYGFRFDYPARQVHISLPLGGYLRALKENWQFAVRGQPIFFGGQLYTKGPWFKQIAVLLLKTPLPILILFAWNWIKNPRARVWWPVVVVSLVVHTLTALHFGMRHELTLLLVLILVASQVQTNSQVSRDVVILLVGWLLYGLMQVWPQPITFANELSFGQANQIFSDSDFDWGQGLIELKSVLSKKQIVHYQLAYFGNVDPKDYLGDYIRMKDENPVASLPTNAVNRGLPVIVSETCYYMCGYYKDPLFSLDKAQVLAHSFLYFHD